MEKLNFMQAVSQFENEIDKNNQEADKNRSIIARFRYAAKHLGLYFPSCRDGLLVSKYKEYTNAGYSEDQSLELAVRYIASKESINNKAKIIKAVKTLYEYDPSFRLKVLKFKREQPFLTSVIFVSSVVLFEVWLMAIMWFVTADTFWTIFVLVIATGTYMWKAMTFLDE